jgi:hypothetical protein
VSQSRKAFGRSVPQWDRSRKTKLNVEKIPEQKAIPRSVPDWHKTRERIANIRKDLDKKVQQEAVSIDSKRNPTGGRLEQKSTAHPTGGTGRKRKPKAKKKLQWTLGKKTTARSIPVWSPTTVLTAPSPA